MAHTTPEQTEFLATAVKRFREIEAIDDHNRRSARDDIRFAYNIDEGQWPEDIRSERSQEGRPCLTSNKLRLHVAQVANREREQRLAGNVRPVDDKGDVVIANIISGMIRQIEHASNADMIYIKAGEHAISGGFGYWRITSEELPDSFEQELFIRKIKNQFAVYLDPDGMYGFIREKMTKDEFEFHFPDAIPEDFEGGQGSSRNSQWFDTDSIYIAEYFYKERVKTTIVEVQDNFTGEIEIIELGDKITRETLEQTKTILREKSPKIFKVKWAKITASQVLEEGEWAGKEIPIIPVEGDWINFDGTDYKRSLIRDAKDPQRMYNYWLSSMTETVALAPKSPWLVTKTMIKGFKEKFWDVAHKKLLPYLPFNPQGNMVPRREQPPQVPTGAAAMLQISAADIPDTTGLREAAFGERSNERTGIAIQQRANRSDFSTFHFADNFKNAILMSTRQLIDLIPKIYDTERVVRILGEEEKTNNPQDNLIRINVPITDDEGNTVLINDLNLGKYDVVEDVKLMSTRRQEQLQGMIAFASGAPNIAPLLLARIAKAQDWPGADDIAKDVEAFLPTLLGVKPAEQGNTEPPLEGDQGEGGLL